MTNRQSILNGLPPGNPTDTLLKEIAVALLEVAKHLGDIVEALDRQGHAR
jgi:hypothetical protein